MEEIWKDIKRFEGKYQVSNLGRVKSFARKTPKILKPRIDKDGYHEYGLYCTFVKKTLYRRGHRLVAEAFIPNPKNLPVINHLNLVKNDNRVDNLEWCTVCHNNRHGYANNILHRTISNLTENEIIESVELYKQGFSYKQLTEHFGIRCRDDYWGEVMSGRKFSNITGIVSDLRRLNIEDRQDCLYKDDLVMSVLKDFYISRLRQCDIVSKYSLSPPFVHEVVKGKTRRYLYDKFMEDHKYA